MSKQHTEELPPALTKKSSRADMWLEIQAMSREIDSQQTALQDAMGALDQARAEAKSLREKLSGAHMRLNVVRAAVA